ncbi:hypothetical protein MLD38_004354 [Melastoma candidum]|uniref:Uncharacterized protein n=1 Tax=Melastoma candidum TaxID=119954 RepID=A0ACB9SE14_9MYRT|nr:hypothetical protein MLD38_004354 [Melastoma candidum]
MGKAGGGAKLPGFCLNRIRPHARVRSPPSVRSKPPEPENGDLEASDRKEANATEEKPLPPVKGRNVMIVVDSSAEAKGALHWALTHTLQNNDTLMLLHVVKSGRKRAKAANGECDQETAPRVHQLLQSMKSLCQSKRPEVRVETAAVEGKEKGPMIVEEARRRGAELLVLGQKKSTSMSWRLLMMWTGRRVGGIGAVEYCIQNADCMAIAVRRKSKKLGGYMITTKRQKDFWLLA